jgi:hypothetical protein
MEEMRRKPTRVSTSDPPPQSSVPHDERQTGAVPDPPQSLATRDQLKRVIAEWVLTNGNLPGFDDRVKQSLPLWKTVKKEMVVYRAQGGAVTLRPDGAPDPSVLEAGYRSVLATSKQPYSIVRYAGESCCLFKITLKPGVRYLDVAEEVTFLTSDNAPALAIKNAVLKDIQSECPLRGAWPTSATPLSVMREVFLHRCLGREKKTTTEYIPAEQEIMVYGFDSTVTLTADAVEDPDLKRFGKQVIAVTYAPARPHGRGRTFRRKAMRRNKNGRGPPRQSRRRRHRDP